MTPWTTGFLNKAPCLHLLCGISLKQKGNNEPVPCNFCGKMYKMCRNITNLAIHLKMMHNFAYLQFLLKCQYIFISKFFTQQLILFKNINSIFIYIFFSLAHPYYKSDSAEIFTVAV